MIDKYSKVHLWMGTNMGSESKYQEYFELDYSVEGDFDDPSYKVCGFCKDVGIKWYDEDFIGIIPRKAVEVSLDDILEDAAVDDDEKESIKEKCLALGINKANALFWYADAELTVKEPIKNSYNGLKYIGVFDGD
ncbi:immunity 22 family protein [Erwinia aphidicola]|uniref:Immunity 22 family protein n=1 Tax=Erwinia aphidicola TaxID=68334 RepID=A0ABU8DBT1_ERWAP|nr:immunity 22 family protein [uncultured Erwinia sp.]